MASLILKQVQDNCPRSLEFIENTLTSKSLTDTLADMITNNTSYSFYAVPLNTGVLPQTDIVVGFIATSPAFFTFSVKNFNMDKILKQGEFQFALHNSPFPSISFPSYPIDVSVHIGSGYIICANVDTEERKVLIETKFKIEGILV